jgi:hypothetical protein
VDRKNIFDTLADRYDATTELNRISTLFHGNHLRVQRPNICYITTIEEFVDTYKFSAWKSRGTCINCKDMRDSLCLEENPNKINSMNMLLDYLEYYTNVCSLVKKDEEDCYICEGNKDFNMLIGNINQLICKLNHKPQFIESEEKIFIVPKNPAGTAASEISSEQTGIAILKYHHYLLKGNLDEKRKLLQTIANEYEDILKSGSPTEIFSKTRALLNKLAIRHGDKENKENIAKFDYNELEKWYDELYQMLLLCILLNDNAPRMKKIDELLKSLKDNKQ